MNPRDTHETEAEENRRERLDDAAELVPCGHCNGQKRAGEDWCDACDVRYRRHLLSLRHPGRKS